MVDTAAGNLRRFADQVDPDRSGTPTFLAVICGTGFAYRRPDGIAVIPVGALAP